MKTDPIVAKVLLAEMTETLDQLKERLVSPEDAPRMGPQMSIDSRLKQAAQFNDLAHHITEVAPELKKLALPPARAKQRDEIAHEIAAVPFALRRIAKLLGDSTDRALHAAEWEEVVAKCVFIHLIAMRALDVLGKAETANAA